MALINCNECGKEVAETAEACPNCGNPINSVKRESTKTVVTPTPEMTEKEPIPPWVVFPAIIIGALLLFVLYMLFSGNNENANTNVNVNITEDQIAAKTVDTPSQPADTTIVTGQPDGLDSTTDAQTPVSEQQISPDTKTEVIENNSTPDKGKVMLDVKIADKDGKIKDVRAEKFYLLDKDLESILSEAKLEKIDNQNLKNSFGLSVMNPGKYSDFNKKALDAINEHIKYDVLTNSNGKAEFSEVEPKSYHLFGIHKIGNGFVIWSSAVTVNKGDNKLQIQPMRPTEIK